MNKLHKVSNTHIIKKNGGWAVMREGAGKVLKIHVTKAAAVKHGTKEAKLGGDLIIHDNDGSVEEWKSYKNE